MDTPEGDLRTLPYHLPLQASEAVSSVAADSGVAVPPAPAGGLDGFYAARLVRKA